MNAMQRLKAIFDEIIREVDSNPRFAGRLLARLGNDAIPAKDRKRPTLTPGAKRAGRRAPGPLDPFSVYEVGGEDELRRQLRVLDIEPLKDIVAEHSMDPAKLAMKWRTTDRLVDLIVTTVRSRASKGDAFRAQPANRDSAAERETQGSGEVDWKEGGSDGCLTR